MFRATSLMLTSLALLTLFQSGSCQTLEEQQDSPLTLNPLPQTLTAPARRWELQGRGDGAEHDFIYTTWANPGTFEISLRAQSQRWLSNASVTLADAGGHRLLQVRTQVGSDVAGQQEGVYRLLNRQPIRVHVHVDENSGPYSVSISGPLDRQ